MKWKIIFVILFLTSVAVMVIYSKLPLVEYSAVTTEVILEHDKDGYPTGEGYSNEPVTKTYKENNAASGAAIGFGIIAAGLVVGFALFAPARYK